jgi:hypothetical protein
MLDFEEPKELQQKAPAAPSIDPARTHRLDGNGTTGRCPAGNQPEKNSGRFLATISVPHYSFLTGVEPKKRDLFFGLGQ